MRPRLIFISMSILLSVGMLGAQTNDLTYQGRLVSAGNAANTSHDFEFRLCASEADCATPLELFAQAIVGQEIKSSQFKSKADKPGVKVSWQVAGIRHDKFAEDNRVPNEEDKPAQTRTGHMSVCALM